MPLNLVLLKTYQVKKEEYRIFSYFHDNVITVKKKKKKN